MAKKPSHSTRVKRLMHRMLAEQAVLIAEKLEANQDAFALEPIVEEYDNGGGQVGTRENPTHTAHSKLTGAYRSTLAALDSMRDPAEIMSAFDRIDW